MDATTDSGADPLGLNEYQQARPRFFPSENSLRWYVRQHRAGLVECGALMLHAGRWLVDARLFDAFVREAARQAAARQAEIA